MNDLIIAGMGIRRDGEGRFSLNDLHRAAGGEKRHGPSYWLTNAQTAELIAELETTGIPVVSLEGRNGGTYVVMELVYAYAMWISPAFHLKVIRAYDAMVTHGAQIEQAMQAFNVPRSYQDALRLAANLADENQRLEAANQEMTPKVEVHDRIASAEGSLCMRDAAKALQIRPIDLRNWLITNRWIYGMPGHGGWLAYQDRIQQGVMNHKVNTVTREDGTDKIVEQPRITPKGLTRIADELRRAAA